MNIHSRKSHVATGVAVGIAFCVANAVKAELTWTGSVNGSWDTTTMNWVTEGGAGCSYQDGDAVRFDDSSTTTEIAAKNRKPGNVVFDITRNLLLSGNAFDDCTCEIVKRGTGTLTLQPESTWSAGSGNLFHGKFTIEGGTVRGGVRAAYNTFGWATKSDLEIDIAGGRLWCNWHLNTGYTSSGGEQTVTVRPGGTLELYVPVENAGANGGFNPFGWINLLGGTLLYGNGSSGVGFTEIRHGLTFGGSNPYVFDYDAIRGGFQAIALHSTTVGKLIQIDVPDLSGGEAADVEFRIPLIKQSSYAGEGFVKTGAGRLVIAAPTPLASSSDPNVRRGYMLDGDVRIEEGVLELASEQTMNPVPARTIYVNTNAELRLSHPYVAMTDDNRNEGDFAITVDHSSLIVSNDFSEGLVFLGALTLDHARFDYSGLKAGYKDFGAIQFGNRLEVIDGEPTELGFAQSVVNPGFALAAFNEDKVPGSSGTEICVHRTGGNAGWDVKISSRLTNRRNMAVGTFSGGFVKTGDGVLCLDNVNSLFSGHVTVREGTLLLGETLGYRESSNAKSILGDFATGYLQPASGRVITVEKGGVLCFNGRNLLYGFDVFSQQPIGATFHVKGGKMKFASTMNSIYNTARNPLPNLTVEDGDIEVGNGQYGGGVFKVIGTFRVCGTRPFVLNRTEGGMHQMITVNGDPETVFDIEDVTGDAEADATFGLNIGQQADGQFLDKRVGFRKTGAGTMRYAAPRFNTTPEGYDQFELKGSVKVEAGTLQMDGCLPNVESVVVKDGGCIAGTGSVSRVVLEDGAGVRVRAGSKASLAVTGSLEINGKLKVHVDNPDGIPEGDIRVTIARAAGGISATGDLNECEIYVDGRRVQDGTWSVTARGNGALCVGFRRGLSITIR